MTFSKIGNEKCGSPFQRTIPPDKGSAETGCRFCRYRPSDGRLFFWTITTARTVFQIKNAIWRESCPPENGIGVCVFCSPERVAPPCSIKHLLSQTLLDGTKRAVIAPKNGKICSGKSDPLFLNTVPHILHQVCGLTIQRITNLLQRIHGQVLHRTHTDGGHRRRTDTRLFCQFLLGHTPQGKHHFDFELYHRLSPLSFWLLYHDFRSKAIRKTKKYFDFRKRNYELRIDKLRFS